MEKNDVKNELFKIAQNILVLANSIDSTLSQAPGIVVKEPEPVKQTVKKPVVPTYQSDPNLPDYDPPPPFQVQKVPSRSEQTAGDGKLVIETGKLIACIKCREVALKVVRNVYNTKEKGRGLGLDAFEVMKEGVELDDQVQLFSEPGAGVSINCPLCNAPRSVYLYGQPKNTEIII